MESDLTSVKLLMVGAGGIGCELLKNLVLTGFTQIEVIDLDTIELSNLNRQFLFQKVHVGKPKATIARESVLKYNHKPSITAHHESIMNPKYNVEYFKQFALVLNALDNKAARSHVNRLCLAADVPLVESGSAGYLGQVTLIKKGLTECYDCLPKPPAKTFPGCTIRNTPSEPIHCIVWAKHLFNQLFGAEDPDEAVSPDGEDPENMAAAGQTAADKQPINGDNALSRVSTRQWANETHYNTMKLFNKLFSDDIKYLLSMSKLWEQRRPPTPLNWSESLNNQTVSSAATTTSATESLSSSDEKAALKSEPSTSAAPVSNENENKLSSQKLLSNSECCQLFDSSVASLHKRLEEEENKLPDANCSKTSSPATPQILYWDKDDEDSLNFVVAAANLRCHIFGIAIKSKFEIKSLAGNIIPAIATTNAIVAGLIVLQALQVLRNQLANCKTVYLRDKPSQGKLIVGAQLVKPNEKCYVCAEQPECHVRINVHRFTVKQFEQKILKKELNMVQPDVEIDDGTGRIIISSEAGETDDNDDKVLSNFGIGHQSSLKCDDYFQNYQLKVTLFHCDALPSEQPDGTVTDYVLFDNNQILKELQEKQQQQIHVTPNGSVAHALLVDADANVIATQNSDEKKRRYQTAFEEEEPVNGINAAEAAPSSTKKLKQSDEPLPVENSVDSEPGSVEAYDIPSSSNSVDNASDAISDEEQQSCVQPKETPTEKRTGDISAHLNNRGATQADEIVIDDDVIIEENSSDLQLINEEERSSSSNSSRTKQPIDGGYDAGYDESSRSTESSNRNYEYQKQKEAAAHNNGFDGAYNENDSNENINGNSNSNGNTNGNRNSNEEDGEDDDVIECSSEEDIIEINDDEN